MLDIFIPTMGRAERLQAVSDNAHRNTRNDHRVVFIVEGSDTDSMGAIPPRDMCVINGHKANYAGAINAAFDQTDSEYFFLGADDLNFHPGWDEAALAKFDGRMMVIGTNDLLNPYVQQGFHATHSLVSREYVEVFGGVVDNPKHVLPEIYDHNFTDTEFIATAKMRCRFYPALDSVVEHLHFVAGKAEMDPTYERGFRQVGEDEKIYESRKDLWHSLSR